MHEDSKIPDTPDSPKEINPYRLTYLNAHPISLQGIDIQKLVGKLDDIDRRISKLNFVQIFLEDVEDLGWIGKAIANNSWIQQLEYSTKEGRYGFWWEENKGENPNILYGLDPEQLYRLRYAIAAIREKLPEAQKSIIPDLDTVIRVSSKSAEDIVYATQPADWTWARWDIRIIVIPK